MRHDFTLKEQDVPYFESGLFREYGIKHAFFTRRGGVSEGVFGSLNFAEGIGDIKDSPENVMENYRTAANVFGLSESDVCRSYQTHTNNVIFVTEKDRGTGVTKEKFSFGVDGLVTDTKDLLLSVRTADCVPVLLCDRQAKVCAAVHAGWRGTLGGITKNAVALMEKHGVKKCDILAAIGPCIGQCCYEVGAELLDFFRDKNRDYADFFKPKNEKYMLDLKGLNAYILAAAGIGEDSISVSDSCTKDDEYNFFSHRRSGKNRGTMSAFITV